MDNFKDLLYAISSAYVPSFQDEELREAQRQAEEELEQAMQRLTEKRKSAERQRRRLQEKKEAMEYLRHKQLRLQEEKQKMEAAEMKRQEKQRLFETDSLIIKEIRESLMMHRSMSWYSVFSEALAWDTFDTIMEVEPYCTRSRDSRRRLREEADTIENTFASYLDSDYEFSALSITMQENELPVYSEKKIQNASDADRKSTWHLLEPLDQASMYNLGNIIFTTNILNEDGVRTLGSLLKTEKVDESVTQSLGNVREHAFLNTYVGSVPHRTKKTVLETSEYLWIFFYYYFPYFCDTVRSFLQMSEKIETLHMFMSSCKHSAYEPSKCLTAAPELFKPLYVCVQKPNIDTVFEQCGKSFKLGNFETDNFETAFGVNKKRRVNSIESGTAIRDKRSEVFTAVLKDGSANTVQSARSTQASTRTMFTENKRIIPEHARYEYTEAAVRVMRCSLQKSFLLLAISFISMAGLCGACQTVFHERSSCEILFPLQEARQTYLCDFGSGHFDAGVSVRRDMSASLEPEFLYCYDINGSLYRDHARYLCRPLKENLAVVGNSTYLNDAKVRNKTAEYKLNDMRSLETNWWTPLISFTICLGIVTIGISAVYKGNSSTNCMVLRSRRGISIVYFMCLVNVSDAGWKMSQSTHSQYDRCQEICDPSIMKMPCDKFCENLAVEENRCTYICTVKMIILVTCVLLLLFGCCLAPVLIRSKYIQAMMKCSKEPCYIVVKYALREAVVENQMNEYQSAEVVIQEPKATKLLQERDVFLTYSEPELDHDMLTSICIETSSDVEIHEETNIKILKNVSKALTDVKEKIIDDQVGNLQSNVEDVLKRQNGPEETERLPTYGIEQSRQTEVHAAALSKTACPFSAEEEEEFKNLSKRVGLVEEGVFDRSNETFDKTPVDRYEEIRIKVEKLSKTNNIKKSRFQMQRRVGFDTKLGIKGCAYEFFKHSSGLIGERTDSANSPNRALHIPNLAVSKQSRTDDKAICNELISKTFDRQNISYRMPPKNHFKDVRFRMMAVDETASEIQNKGHVNGLHRFSPITSAGRDHKLDRGSPTYCLGTNLKENDAEDDCHVLRQITWLPLNELPVPDIYTCITVHSAAQVILNRIASGERVGAQESMKFEILRVCTFRNYPSEDKPFRILFSIAGMYYASDRDEVVCYSCGLRKAGWKEADIPIEVHKKIRPSCEFLVNNSAVNFPIPELERSQLLKFKTLDDLLNSSERPPTQQTEATGGSHGNFDLNTAQNPQYRFFVPPPKHPQYAIQSVRLDTFKGWPTNIPQTPQIMAECGYYYAGFGDCVRCFHCGIGLRHWTEDDYPWIEHARWSKDCAYLRQIKGEEFIQNVHLAIDKDEEPEDLIPATASGQPADMSQVTPNDESNQILLTDPAQSVLEMGYQPRTIKKAVDIILRSEGRSGISAEKIMETIFMLEERSDNLEQEVANITISGASSETELQEQNSSERSHSEVTGEQSRSSGQNSSSSQTQRNTAKGQASNKDADHAQRSSEVKAQAQKGTYVKSEDRGHAKSDPKTPSNSVTKNEDAASPSLSPHSSLEEKSKGETGTSRTSRDTSKIKAENQKLKEQTICKVCLDKPVSIVFLPCGHLVTCAECAPAMKKCPICRGIVKGMVKAFMS